MGKWGEISHPHNLDSVLHLNIFTDSTNGKLSLNPPFGGTFGDFLSDHLKQIQVVIGTSPCLL